VVDTVEPAVVPGSRPSQLPADGDIEKARAGVVYPQLNPVAAPGVRVEALSEEPPVYVARNVLSDEACEVIIKAAEAGNLDEVAYDQGVSVNFDRLRLLLPLVLVATALPVHTAAEAGLGAAECACVGATALGAGLAGVAVLTAAVRAVVEASIGGKVFVGTKWDANSGDSPRVGEAVDSAMSQIERLTGRSRKAFENPLVTRYREGDRQRRHFDARLSGDAELAEFVTAGHLGQRLVQCVVYLNDVPAGHGGETRFLHPSLQDLKVQPTRGDCLIFFPAFADGRADLRMEHAGEPVLSGCKYILNTWVCQNEVP